MGSFEKILFIFTGNKWRATQQKTDKHTNKLIGCWLEIRPSGNLARWVSGPIGKWRIGHPTGWIPNNTSKTKADRKLSVQEYNKKWLNVAEAPISLPRINSHRASYCKQVKHGGRKKLTEEIGRWWKDYTFTMPTSVGYKVDSEIRSQYEIAKNIPDPRKLERHGSPTQKVCVV